MAESIIKSNVPTIMHGWSLVPAISANSYSTLEITFPHSTKTKNSYRFLYSLTLGSSQGSGFIKGVSMTSYRKTANSVYVAIFAGENVNAGTYHLDWVVIE